MVSLCHPRNKKIPAARILYSGQQGMLLLPESYLSNCKSVLRSLSETLNISMDCSADHPIFSIRFLMLANSVEILSGLLPEPPPHSFVVLPNTHQSPPHPHLPLFLHLRRHLIHPLLLSPNGGKIFVAADIFIITGQSVGNDCFFHLLRILERIINHIFYSQRIHHLYYMLPLCKYPFLFIPKPAILLSSKQREPFFLLIRFCFNAGYLITRRINSRFQS